jgi:23S rRNA pseudouridine1911/1915/1917 synthase
MPYILKKYDVTKALKVEDFLISEVKLSEELAFSLLQKGKVLDHKDKKLQKSYILKDGFIQLYVFEARSRNLKPLFETEHFAIFDKPSGLLVHPVGRSTQYTLLDEIYHLYGQEANFVHRIDLETSGLILVAKNPYSLMLLSDMFEKKKFIKKYQAIVENELKDEILINKNIFSSNGKIKVKMQTSKDGKESSTLVKPISYNKEQNQTLVEAIPYTGRQHQIRVHLDSMGHRIVGDPIYGLDENDVDKILKKQVSLEERIDISGDKRLNLHAFYLEFTFLKRTYKLFSKQDFSL